MYNNNLLLAKDVCILYSIPATYNIPTYVTSKLCCMLTKVPTHLKMKNLLIFLCSRAETIGEKQQ